MVKYVILEEEGSFEHGHLISGSTGLLNQGQVYIGLPSAIAAMQKEMETWKQNTLLRLLDDNNQEDEYQSISDFISKEMFYTGDKIVNGHERQVELTIFEIRD